MGPTEGLPGARSDRGLYGDSRRRMRETVKCAKCGGEFRWNEVYRFVPGALQPGARAYCPHCGFRVADSRDAEHWDWYGPNRAANAGKLLPPGAGFPWGKPVPYHAAPPWDAAVLDIASLSGEHKEWVPAVLVDVAEALEFNRRAARRAEVEEHYRAPAPEVAPRLRQLVGVLPVLPHQCLRVVFGCWKRDKHFPPEVTAFEGDMGEAVAMLLAEVEEDMAAPGCESVCIQLRNFSRRPGERSYYAQVAEGYLAGSRGVVEGFANWFLVVEVYGRGTTRPYLVGRADRNWFCVLAPPK